MVLFFLRLDVGFQSLVVLVCLWLDVVFHVLNSLHQLVHQGVCLLPEDFSFLFEEGQLLESENHLLLLGTTRVLKLRLSLYLPQHS